MEIKINGERKVLDTENLIDVIRDSNLDPTRVAVELNGKIVPRADFRSTILKDGDSLEIVHFVGGG